ncbi:MAG: hypothetical protein ABTQ25_07950 [Nitrosomonas ureae]
MICKKPNELVRVVLLVCFLLPNISTAQESPVFDNLERGSIRALEWFQALTAPITAIVEAEKRTQLLEALSELSKDLYAIEQDKLVFIQLLKREELDQPTIYRRTSMLMEDIDKTRRSLKKVGPLLRLKYQLGGAEVETLLSEAAVTRKIWVNQFYEEPEDLSQRQDLIAEGEAALKALREASLELSKLITRL